MEHKIIALPKLNQLAPSLESTALKLMEEMGELAQAIGMMQRIDGQPTNPDEHEALAMVTAELLDVAQTAITMMYVLEEGHNVDIGQALEVHVQKLINKGYLST